jgi:hypothetical protein
VIRDVGDADPAEWRGAGPKIIARPATWSQPIIDENQTSMNALGCTMVQRMPLRRTARSTSRL